MKEIIAIIGRPNVGKSSLFNKLAEKNLAIVHDMPGVTRDRNYANAEWYGVNYLLIDTGGIDSTEDKEIYKEMMSQANLAIEEASRIIFVLDGKEGITAADAEIVDYLRKFTTKKVFYAVNKLDIFQKQDVRISEFYSLGIQKVYPISILSNLGIDDLMDDVFEGVEDNPEDNHDYVAKVAVIGRPNVGKSSLINKLLGEDRLIVQDEAGTTRDSIDAEIKYNGRKYLFIDTAGIRRKSKVKYSLEKYMIVKAFLSIDRADVVVFMIDSQDLLTDQDKRLISLIVEKGKPVLILVNKWDLIEKDSKTHKNMKKDLEETIKEIKNPTLIFVSALMGTRIFKIFDEVDKLKEQTNFRVTTNQLNQFMQEVIKGHPHPMIGGRSIKFKYISQVATNPPTFMISVNHADLVMDSYTRFITNRLRETYPFGSVPIRIFYKGTNVEK